jgi:hypothetical protein
LATKKRKQLTLKQVNLEKIVNADYAAFLKKTKRTSSDRAAQLFAIKITRTNTEKFSGLNEREILILLLGKVPALYD